MVIVELSDRQADHLLWRLAEHVKTASIDDDVLFGAFTKLHDAYKTQAVVVVTSRDIEAAVDKCRAQELKDEPQLRMTRSEYQLFRSERQAEGALIDPEKCDVTWWFAATLDPYGILGIGPDDEYCTVGREYFVSRPGAKDWVNVGDISEEARERLWLRYGGVGEDAAKALQGLRALIESERFNFCDC